MSTDHTAPDAARYPDGPRAVAPNGGAPSVVAEVIARREAERDARRAAERQDSRP